MSSHHGILVHVIFSPNYRKPVLSDGWRGELIATHLSSLRDFGPCSIETTDLRPWLSPTIASRLKNRNCARTNTRLRLPPSRHKIGTSMHASAIAHSLSDGRT